MSKRNIERKNKQMPGMGRATIGLSTALVCMTLASGAIAAQQKSKPNGWDNPLSNSAQSAPAKAWAMPSHIEVNIDTARPLLALADQVQLKLGIPVSYEDILWVSDTDAIPFAKYNSARTLKDSNRLVPARGKLQLAFDSDENTEDPKSFAAKILGSVIVEHVKNKNPGEFRIVALDDDEGFSIVPNRAKDATGHIVSAQSPLDVRISIPSQTVSGAAPLDLILKAVTAATGAKFSVFDPLESGPIQVSATNEVARSVLARTMRAASSTETSWYLNYDPADKIWAFGIRPVYRETGNMTREGKPEIDVMRWPN